MPLTIAEWGPATLTTIGDVISVPSSSFTPRMRLPSLRISTTSRPNRNSEPFASAARCRLCVDNCGSEM